MTGFVRWGAFSVLASRSHSAASIQKQLALDFSNEDDGYAGADAQATRLRSADQAEA